MTNKQVMQAFATRQYGQASNVRSDGDQFYSYATCVAVWSGNMVRLTSAKYSVTTSKQVSQLASVLSSRGVAYSYGMENL